MGCSSSKADMPPFKPTKPHSGRDSAPSAHGFNVFNVVALRDERFDPDKLEDPVSSWNLSSVPEGYPRDKLLPPDRELHEKHLKRLNRFLKNLEDAPMKLGESRRLRVRSPHVHLIPSRPAQSITVHMLHLKSFIFIL